MEYFKLALTFGSKLMSMFPDYNQRKKAEFQNLKNKYNNEITKQYPDRDDDLIMNLREELKIHLESFYEEVKK